MSATIVSEAAGHTTTAVSSDTYAIGATYAAGSAAFIIISCNTKTRTISSVTDSASNTGWVQLCGDGASGAGSVFIWWNPSLPASITSITGHYSGTSKVDWTAMNVTGLAGTVQVTGTSTDHTTSATSGSSSMTTTGAAFLVAAACASATTVNSVSGDVTVLQENPSGSGVGQGVAAWSETAAGTYTATFTYGAAATSTTAIVALNLAGGGTVSGTASNVTSAPGAATGVASNHQFSGTAAGPTAAPGAATGAATRHLFSGAASGNTTSPGAVTGTVQNHLFEGTASGPTGSSGAATGVASAHAVHGTAAGPTGTSGAASGAASTHTVSATAGGAVPAPGAATGVATPHAIQGQARGPVAPPPIVFDAAADVGFGTNNYTNEGNLVLIFVAYAGTAVNVTSATYGGQALTFLARDIASGNGVECWALLNPPTGTNALAVTLSGAAGGDVNVVSFENVRSLGDVVHGNSSGSITLTSPSITGEAGGLLVGGTVSGGGDAVSTSPQVDLVTDHGGETASSLPADGTAQTMTWNMTSGTPNCAAVVVALNPMVSGLAIGAASTHTVSATADGHVTTSQVAIGQALGEVTSAYRRRPRPSVQ